MFRKARRLRELVMENVDLKAERDRLKLRVMELEERILGITTDSKPYNYGVEDLTSGRRVYFVDAYERVFVEHQGKFALLKKSDDALVPVSLGWVSTKEEVLEHMKKNNYRV